MSRARAAAHPQAATGTGSYSCFFSEEGGCRGGTGEMELNLSLLLILRAFCPLPGLQRAMC